MNLRDKIKDMMKIEVEDLLMDVKKTMRDLHEDADGRSLSSGELDDAKDCAKILSSLVYVCDGADWDERRNRLSELREDRNRATIRG